jgi:hypothetical protein
MPNRLLLAGGRIVPRPDDPRTDSVLVDGDRIAAVGPADALRREAAGAEVVELAGRALVPGFRDAHFHFFQSGLFASRPSLAAVRRRDDALDLLRDACRDAPAGALVFAEAWDEMNWDRPEAPTRAELDAIAPDRPVVARRVCSHAAVFSSAAIAALGDDAGGGWLDRDSGLGREGPVMDLDERFAPDAEGVRRAFALAAARCLALGITTACDFLRPRMVEAYRDHWDAAGVPLDLDAYALEACFDVHGLLESLPADPGLRLRGMKIFGDGSVGGRTAAVGADYADRPGVRGELLWSDEDLAASIGRAHDRGMAVAVHAIGDRTIAQVLDAFARRPADENRRLRHRIEHFELPGPGAIERLVSTGIRPCVQPNFVGCWAHPGGLYESALGADRVRRMNPFRSLVTAGTGVFFGSDGMPASPLFGVRSAVHHPVASERLDAGTAVRLYTEEAARAVSGDASLARIEPGAPADLVVLPGTPDVLEGPVSGAERVEVDLTVKAGTVVHRKPTSATPAGPQTTGP